MPIQYMYPEGWLIDYKRKSLFSFEKDPMNPLNEGYIGFWIIDDANSKQFRYRTRALKSKALRQWMRLQKQGWQLFEVGENAA